LSTDFLRDLTTQCPPETPLRFLRFTWFGDFACSSGEHYVPGSPQSFEKILQQVNKEHSDDLVENLACWALRDQVPGEPTLPVWRDLCWKFYELIKPDYLSGPVRYSPEYPRLFATPEVSHYLRVINQHNNCGGAMRSSSLAYGGATPQEHLALVGMTHLHPESLAGAYALYEAVRTLKGGNTMEEMWSAAIEAAWQGEQQAVDLLTAWGVAEVERGSMPHWLERVHLRQDALCCIQNWHAEGITTRFVVSAALQIASEAISLGTRDGLRHVIEQGIAIGGDPDTLGSMGMTLIGAYFGEALQDEIDAVLDSLPSVENLEIPDIFR